ncbi:MAG TPA: ChuX/HutX family heme-like substrate-binding protein [Burkholderiales bacterium]|nr:ChuX/HutX family heme-like substrate-binding protein [Burkholderiales bacterium]
MDANQLLTAWSEARADGLNNRAVAAKLGVTEAELIASACGRFVTRLRPDTLPLLRELPALGEIKAIVRNPTAVIERAGTVRGSETAAVGVVLVQADHFELMCQAPRWSKAFALREETSRGVKQSVQFFTAAGTSAAKFFLRPSSNLSAFANLVSTFADPDQSQLENIEHPATESGSPLQRLPAAPLGGLTAFLGMAEQLRQLLTFVVRNEAATLSTSRAVERVKRSDRGGWMNVLHDEMDIHLHDERIRYVRCVPDADAGAGWLHWYSDEQAIALSVRCGESWEELAQAARAAAA